MNLFENLQSLKESEDNVLFSFIWEKGSINDNIIKYLKSNNIQFRYDHYFKLEAKIKGEWVNFDYKGTVDGLTTIYIKPKNNTITESNGKELYTYVGPVFRFDRMFDTLKEPIETIAVSYDEANNNFCYKLKKQYGLEKGQNLTIDKEKIKRDTVLDEYKDLQKMELEYKDDDEDELNPLINDPKYNFEDPDRNDDYIVESNNREFKYSIKFDIDVEHALDDEGLSLDDDEIEVTITDIDDSSFDKAFNNKEELEQFEKSLNEGFEEEIKIVEIFYNGFADEYTGEVLVTLTNELKELQDFAEEIIMYLYENNEPTFNYDANGITWSMAWSYHADGPVEEKHNFEDSGTLTAYRYNNVRIERIN